MLLLFAMLYAMLCYAIAICYFSTLSVTPTPYTLQTFRSKEISKSNVVDDMVSSNSILYKPGEHPDHVVVIK